MKPSQLFERSLLTIVILILILILYRGGLYGLGLVDKTNFLNRLCGLLTVGILMIVAISGFFWLIGVIGRLLEKADDEHGKMNEKDEN